MKNLINSILFGRNARHSGLIALVLVGLIALGCSCGKDFNLANLTSGGNSNSANVDNSAEAVTEEAPPDAEVESLVKETTSQFAEAVDTGDFSTIYNNASSDFQNTYTQEEMTTAFKSYTDKKKVVVPILKKVAEADAEFTRPVSIRTEKGLKILVANGNFPTKPYNVRFDYEYVMREDEWKLLKLIINIP